MEIIHETKMKAICPNGGHINNYEVKINVPGFIEVEKLKEMIDKYIDTKIFQEDLTKELCKQIQGYYNSENKTVYLELKGDHLGFMITTRYHYPETRYNK